jgi:hypothetical protein
MTDTAKHTTTPPPPAACARADPAASGGTRCSVAAVTADESVRREVARRQAAALGAVSPAPSGGRTPSRWAHVPLAALFEDAGNPIARRRRGTAACGHEPFHGSRSGTCVTIDEILGLWYCRSCRRGGDAVRFVRDLHGWGYPRTAAWLAARFGAPAGDRPRPERPSGWVEV